MHITGPAREALERLNDERDANFDKIIALLACELGYGDSASLTAELHERLAREANETYEQWEETAEIAASPIEPKTPLQHLLRERHRLDEEMMDIFDAEMAKNHPDIGMLGEDED